MKNVQVIDGALNSTFDIFAVPDELFQLMFPDNRDVAFIDDVDKVFHENGGEANWSIVYSGKVDKKHVVGIHGTLHLTTDGRIKKSFPTFREAEVSHTLK